MNTFHRARPRRCSPLPSSLPPLRATALLGLVASIALVGPLSTSADADDGHDTRTGIAYGTETEQKLDLYLPAEGDRNGAAVVLVHGGGWSSGGRASMGIAATLLAEEGFVAASIDYRLVRQTDSPFPDAVHDVQLAVQWIADNAHRYGIEPDKIGMIGSSAGGHLAAMVATLGTTGDPTKEPLVTQPSGVQVAAVASWSGIYDLSSLEVRENGDSSCGDDSQCITFSRPTLVPNFIGCSLRDCPERYEQASPIDHVGPSTAPMFLANATDELIPMSQPEAMLTQLSAAGVPNSHQFLPGKAHASLYINDVWGNTEAFLRRHLGVEEPSLADWLVPAAVAVLLIAALAAVAVRERRRYEQRAAIGGESSTASGDRR